MYAFRAIAYRIKLYNMSSIRRMSSGPRAILLMVLDTFYFDAIGARNLAMSVENRLSWGGAKTFASRCVQ